MFSLYRQRRKRKDRTPKTAKDKSRAEARRLKRHVKQCEHPGCTQTKHLEVHHLDENALNNKLSNLRKLCLEHHLGKHAHQPVARLMRKKLLRLGKKIQQEVDRGPVMRFVKRLIHLFYR